MSGPGSRMVVELVSGKILHDGQEEFNVRAEFVGERADVIMKAKVAETLLITGGGSMCEAWKFWGLGITLVVVAVAGCATPRSCSNHCCGGTACDVSEYAGSPMPLPKSAQSPPVEPGFSNSSPASAAELFAEEPQPLNLHSLPTDAPAPPAEPNL